MKWPTKKQIANWYIRLIGISIIGAVFCLVVYILIDGVGALATTAFVLFMASMAWALIHSD